MPRTDVQPLIHPEIFYLFHKYTENPYRSFISASATAAFMKMDSEGFEIYKNPGHL